MRNFTTVGLSIRQNFGIPFIENLNITPNDFLQFIQRLHSLHEDNYPVVKEKPYLFSKEEIF